MPAGASRMLSWVPNGPVQTGFREPPSSSGLGRRPFKAVTRVRTPLGVRKYLFDQHFGAGVDKPHGFVRVWPRSAVG